MKAAVLPKMQHSHRRHVETRVPRALFVDPLIISLTVYVTLLWFLYFGGYVFLDARDGMREVKAAVLGPLIGSINAIHLLTILHICWALLFLHRGVRTWRSDRRPRWQSLTVSVIGVALAVQLQVMTLGLADAMQVYDNDEIPSDAVMIEQFREHRALLDRRVERLQPGGSGKSEVPAKHWSFELRPGERLPVEIFALRNEEDYAIYRTPVAPRYGWLAREDGREIHLAPHTRGIAPRFLVKGYYRGTAPEPLRDSLDDISEGAPGFAAYRHIEGDWYLFVIRTPVEL